jgi:hypothetical protein
MITRFIIWLEDTYDELIHNHILKFVWEFPLWFHKLLAQRTEYRVIQFMSINDDPYRWELHKEYPSYPNLAYKQQSRVDKEPEPKTIIEVLEDLKRYIAEGNCPTHSHYEIWYSLYREK